MVSLIKKFPTQKILVPEGFTGDFHQTFKAESMQVLFKHIQQQQQRKSWKEGNPAKFTLPGLIPKPDKDSKSKL